MYHSTNGGATWGLMDFAKIQGNHKVAGIQFTSTSGLIFGMDRYSSLVKSIDGGTTWSNVNNPGSLMGVLVDYNNPNHMVAADYSHIYSTTNGGTSWNTIYTNTNGALLAGAFFDGNNVYAATASGVMTSTDGGATFSAPVATGINLGTQGIYSFAGAKSGGTTRFFCVTVGTGNLFPGNEGDACYDWKGVYSMDVGGSWTSKVSGLPSTADPCYVSMLPTDINTVYLAGGSNNGTGPTVVKSTNAGSNWTSVFLTNNNQNIQTGWMGYGGDRDWGYGEYADGFTVSATDSTKLMLTDMGAAYISTDGGTNWHAAYVAPASLNPANQSTPVGKAYTGNGLEDTTVWGLTWADSSNLWASFTDIRAIRSTDSGSSWSFNFTGDTFGNMYRCVVQQGTGNLYGVVSNTHDIYQWESYQDDSHIDASTTGQVLVSTNKGASWSMVHDFAKSVVWAAIDPNNANKMYVSVANHAGSGTAGGIYVTSNLNLGSSSTWTKVANPPRTEGHPFNIVVLNDGTLVATYAGRLDANWNYTASSGVFVSTDGGTTWADRSDALMQYHTRDITIDPADASQNTWFAGVWTTNNGVYSAAGQIFKTTNRGVSWTPLLDSAGSSAMSRLEQVAINPSSTDEAYVTTAEKGLWYTSNIHAATPTFTRVTNYGLYSPIRVFFNPYNAGEVWVTSFGYGIVKGAAQVGVATKLGFGQQPTNTPVNATITPAVTVYVQDANGQTVTTDHSNVTIAINTGSGTLAGTLTVAAVNGIATFNNLSINTAGAFTLKATDGSLTQAVSNSFNITSSVATKLGYIQQPTNTTAGASISPAVTVAVQDVNGATVTTDTSNVTIALFTGTGTLSGTLTKAAVNGIATFSNLSINLAGAKTIRATDGSLTAVTSNSFNITAAAATKLGYIQAPTSTPASCSITPPVKVAIQDTYGNTVTTNNSNVTVALYAGTGTLSGTLTVAAVNGIATFSNLSINSTGTNKQLRATDGSLTQVTSANFSITSSTATKLGFIQQPTNTVAGATITPAITVAIQNSSGQTVTTNNTDVTIVLYSGTGTLSGTLTVAAVNGIATFSNLSINATGAKTLRVTDGTLTQATSNSFNITASQVATKLGFIQQPTNTTVNTAISPAVTVAVQDATGATVTTDNSNVTIAINTGTGTLAGTLTVAAVNGIATFNNLSINTAGNFTLKATDGTLTQAISNSFTISASSGTYTFSDLVDFNTTNGKQPMSTLIADASGNLYGTTYIGGANSVGSVFKMDHTTHAITTLATFNGTNGANPMAGLVMDASGNLYGTTNIGGANNLGTVFEVVSGSGTVTTLASFSGTGNGANPQASLYRDASGNLFGTAYAGGSSSKGTVFEVVNGSGTITTLVTFTGTNGANPMMALTKDASGNLYGTTSTGGANSAGTIFKLTAGTYALTTLHDCAYADGSTPESTLLIDASGNIFGTTWGYNPGGQGGLFEIDAATHTYTNLASFTSSTGNVPMGNMVMYQGTLYGTTGTTVFKYSSGTLTAINTFSWGTGSTPLGLYVDANGNLFGVCQTGGSGSAGTIYELVRS